MKKPIYIIFTFISLSLSTGCSSVGTENIKDWLKEGTREHQESTKENNKTGKTNLKSYLEKRGCTNGSSAKLIETKNKDAILYEVICVTKSKKFVVKCVNNSCSE
jgi:hypothetical protein